MVVLAMIAALLAVAFPQFVRLYARVRAAFERSELERQLLALPQEVRAAGRDGVLSDPSAPLAEAGPEDLRARLDLPPGWRLSVPKPIFYHFTGACDGGDVVFSLPPLSLHYVLTPPLCRPVLANAG